MENVQFVLISILPNFFNWGSDCYKFGIFELVVVTNGDYLVVRQPFAPILRDRTVE
jgi:hypothetical protein